MVGYLLSSFKNIDFHYSFIAYFKKVVIIVNFYWFLPFKGRPGGVKNVDSATFLLLGIA